MMRKMLRAAKNCMRLSALALGRRCACLPPACSYSTAKHARVHARALHLTYANAEPLCDRVQRTLRVVTHSLRRSVAAAARGVAAGAAKTSNDPTVLLSRNAQVWIGDIFLHAAPRLHGTCTRIRARTLPAGIRRALRKSHRLPKPITSMPAVHKAVQMHHASAACFGAAAEPRRCVAALLLRGGRHRPRLLQAC